MHPNQLPENANEPLICPEDTSVKKLWDDMDIAERQSIVIDRNRKFRPLAIRLNCYNPPRSRQPDFALKFKVVADTQRDQEHAVDYIFANHDTFPLCAEPVFERGKYLQGFWKILDTVYVPTGIGGNLDLQIFQDGFLCGTRSYTYGPIHEYGKDSLDLFLALISPFLEPTEEKPNIEDTRIRLIAVSAEKKDSEVEVMDSVKAFWLDGLRKNYRFLRLENEAAIEDSGYYGCDLESMFKSENEHDKYVVSARQRGLRIALLPCESIAPRARKNSKNEYDLTLLEQSRANLRRSTLNFQRTKFKPEEGGGGWSLWQPINIPLVRHSDGKMPVALPRHCHGISSQSGGPSNVALWLTPDDLSLYEAAKWQLRQFLFEQCFGFGVAWDYQEPEPNLSFMLKLQLFIPPDPKGVWVFWVPTKSHKEIGPKDVQDVVDFPRGEVKKGILSDNIAYWMIEPKTNTWEYITPKFHINHKDLNKYNGLECRLCYCPAGFSYPNPDTLGSHTKDQPEARFTLHITRTSDDNERRIAFQSFVANKDDTTLLRYPIAWDKRGFSRVIEDLPNSVLTRKSEGPGSRYTGRRWQLTSNLSTAVSYTSNNYHGEAGDSLNADIGIHVFQNFAAPARFGKEWVRYPSVIAVALSALGCILWLIHKKWVRDLFQNLRIIKAPAEESYTNDSPGIEGSRRDKDILMRIIFVLVPAVNLFIFPHLPSEVAISSNYLLFMIVPAILLWALYDAIAPVKERAIDPWFPSVPLFIMSVITYAYSVSDHNALWMKWPDEISVAFYAMPLWIAVADPMFKFYKNRTKSQSSQLPAGN